MGLSQLRGGKIKMEKREKTTAAVIHAVLIVAAFIMVIPFLWMVFTAFKTVTESTSVNPFVIFPTNWRFDSFVEVWNNYNFLVLYI